MKMPWKKHQPEPEKLRKVIDRIEKGERRLTLLEARVVLFERKSDA